MHRTVIAAALVATLAAGGVATAAAKPKPKPVCTVIKDAVGDAWADPLGTGLHQGPQDENADILSADISSDAKWLTAVIRVKSLATPDTSWPEAHLYMLSWSVPGHSAPVYLSGTIDPNPASAGYGPQFVFGDTGSQDFTVSTLNYYNIDFAAKVKATVNVAKATITLSVPIGQLKGYGTFKPGSVFTGINATTQELVNGPTLGTNIPGMGGSVAYGALIDTAVTNAPYVAGTPSCVKPGS